MSGEMNNKVYNWISLGLVIGLFLWPSGTARAEAILDDVCSQLGGETWPGTENVDEGGEEDDDEIEIILDGLTAPGGSADKDGEEDDDEIEIILDGLTAEGQTSISEQRWQLECLCRQRQNDDHADVLACATSASLGQIQVGDLKAGAGERFEEVDRDLFLIILPGDRQKTWPLEWSWISEAPVQLRLLDGTGHPLRSVDVVHSKVQRWEVPLTSDFYYLEVKAMSNQTTSYAWKVEVVP